MRKEIVKPMPSQNEDCVCGGAGWDGCCHPIDAVIDTAYDLAQMRNAVASDASRAATVDRAVGLLTSIALDAMNRRLRLQAEAGHPYPYQPRELPPPGPVATDWWLNLKSKETNDAELP
jgi:hypothetical protein